LASSSEPVAMPPTMKFLAIGVAPCLMSRLLLSKSNSTSSPTVCCSGLCALFAPDVSVAL
jgi:hypothetical protein